MKIRRRDFVALATALPLAATPEVEESAPSGEGPFYKPGAPVKTSLLEPGLAGTPLEITGQVLNTAGHPIPGAILDVWHADSTGTYDNQGFRLRGKIVADAQGRYAIRSIQPVPYGTGGSNMRAAHIHLKVSGDRTKVLTTEIYFRGGKFTEGVKQALQVDLLGGDSGRRGRFNFVLKQNG